MQGWVSLYRELLHKPIWTTSTPEQKTVLVTLLLMANHEDNEWEFKGEKFTVKKGQMITSLESIVTNCGKGVTIQNVRTALKRFEKLGFLTNESTNKNRLITLVNWASFQQQGTEPNKQVNKQLTSNQQATNKQLTTNNNDNNVNNENNDNKDIKHAYAEFVMLTNSEYDKLVEKMGEGVACKYIERLDNYIGSKGKKYKSHYRAILTWYDKDTSNQSKGAQTNESAKSSNEQHSSGPGLNALSL